VTRQPHLPKTSRESLPRSRHKPLRYIVKYKGWTGAWAVEDTNEGTVVERFNTDDSEADKRAAEDLAWELNEKAAR
jgi:hypothetical protein